jgi:Lrp/AsnC family transcriptional regulator for asnA, asnC and gidA
LEIEGSKEMDELDVKILAELINDGRKPFSKIAKKIGVTTQTISRRYKEMKKNRVIKTCMVSVSFNKLGYKGIANLMINAVSKENNKEIVEKLWKVKDVFLVSRTVGDCEIFAVLTFRDLNILYEKINRIKEIPGVKHVDLSFRLIKEGDIGLMNKFSTFLLEQQQ